jgi:hypothetical protein
VFAVAASGWRITSVPRAGVHDHRGSCNCWAGGTPIRRGGLRTAARALRLPSGVVTAGALGAVGARGGGAPSFRARACAGRRGGRVRVARAPRSWSVLSDVGPRQSRPGSDRSLRYEGPALAPGMRPMRRKREVRRRGRSRTGAPGVSAAVGSGCDETAPGGPRPPRRTPAPAPPPAPARVVGDSIALGRARRVAFRHGRAPTSTVAAKVGPGSVAASHGDRSGRGLSTALTVRSFVPLALRRQRTVAAPRPRDAVSGAASGSRRVVLVGWRSPRKWRDWQQHGCCVRPAAGARPARCVRRLGVAGGEPTPGTPGPGPGRALPARRAGRCLAKGRRRGRYGP